MLKNIFKITFLKTFVLTYLLFTVTFFVIFYFNHKPQQLSSVINYAQDIRKIQNSDMGFIYYSLSVVLVDRISIDTSTGALNGNFYFSGDPSKNIFNYNIYPNGNGEYTIGYFTEKPTVVAKWEMLTKNNFLDVLESNREAYITISLRSDFDQDLEYSKDLDRVLEMYKNGVEIPDTFVFKATSINIQRGN